VNRDDEYHQMYFNSGGNEETKESVAKARAWKKAHPEGYQRRTQIKLPSAYDLPADTYDALWRSLFQNSTHDREDLPVEWASQLPDLWPLLTARADGGRRRAITRIRQWLLNNQDFEIGGRSLHAWTSISFASALGQNMKQTLASLTTAPSVSRGRGFIRTKILSDPPKKLVDEDELYFLDSLRDISTRHLVVTQRGYVGSVSYDAMVGDIICALFECNKLVILRPEGALFRIIGDAYVHGFMNSEAVVNVEEADVEEFEIW
jgi:hypothetical protein